MIETLLGGLLGGLFRLAPEILRVLDRWSERQHELRMQDRAQARAQLSGADLGAAIRDAFPDALRLDPATPLPTVAPVPFSNSVPWADALSSSVRPVITYGFMALYCAAKTATFISVTTAGADWSTGIQQTWTDADQALWAGVLNFWFLGRVFDRVRP